jgi:hypothetical protein
MEKKEKAALIYGYAVCLVAVITFIICIAGTVNAVLDLSDPIHAGYNRSGDPSLASFDNYKMDVLKSSAGETVFVPDDQQLKAMYEAARNDKIQAAEHDAYKNIMVNGLLIIVSLALFFFHWKWMRRLSKTSATGS